jgi:NAD(P)-dependent dehydrogenase (short-subunit alcohol dehydrogenase family)
VPDQSGRTAFVTGSNTGIGWDAARVLAARGARVLLGCRSSDKATSAREKILALHPQADVAAVSLDLGSLASVRAAAEQVAQEARLDLLINNAGIMVPPRELTVDGFESQFGVNHLGHFALTGLLLPKLKDQPAARIVSVSSHAHRAGRIHFDDLNAEKSYSRQGRYGQSKLANLLFTYELQRRLEAAGSPAIAVACHPGGAETELARYYPAAAQAIIFPLFRFMLNTSAEGALPTLRAAADPGVHGGEYFGPEGLGELARGARKVKSTTRSHDTALARRLWDVSVELTGVDPGLASVAAQL